MATTKRTPKSKTTTTTTTTTTTEQTTAQANTIQPTETKKGTTKMKTELITAYLLQALPPNNPKAYINTEGKQKLFYTNIKQKDGIVYQDKVISQGYQLLFKTSNGDHFIIHINTYEETSKAGNAYRSANIFLSNAINQLNPDRRLYLDNDQELTDLQVKELINKLYKKPLNFTKTQVTDSNYFNYNIEKPAPEELPFKLI